MSRRAWLAAAALSLPLGACRTTAPANALTPRDELVVLLQRGDTAKAVPLAERLWAAAPDDLSLARAVAEAHTKAGTGAQLVERLASRDDAVAHYVRGLVRFASAQQATDAALTDFERACALRPEEPEFHYRLGLALVESERYEAGLVALKRALELPGAKPGWWLPVAKARFATGDGAGAVAAVRTVLAGDPSPAEAAHARALMERIADPFVSLPKAAREPVERALQWLEVADLPQQAIGELELVQRDFPDLAAVHSLLGLAYARLDDGGRAIEELKRAIELNPEDGKAYLYLGEVYLGRQRPKPAREQFEKAVEKNPALDGAWRRLGELAAAEQDVAGARRAFGIAARLVPERADYRVAYAAALQADGDLAAAERELLKALERDDANVELMLRLGLLNGERATAAKLADERKRAAGEAVRWLRKVIDAQPENALASRALQQAQALQQ